jgi:Zn-dependent M28 family amino/carboxypeptidase
MQDDKKVNCFKCRYHRITWEPKFPYACDAIGFKSKSIPSLEVFKNSNMPCQLFDPKDKVDK